MSKKGKRKNVKKQGTISQEFGAFPEPHEIATAKVFAREGYDVYFMKPRRVQGMHTPDVQMMGVLWEFKAPDGVSDNTMAKQIKRALVQSKSIVIDTRRTKLTDSYCEKELRKICARVRSIERLKMVNKQAEILDIKP